MRARSAGVPRVIAWSSSIDGGGGDAYGLELREEREGFVGDVWEGTELVVKLLVAPAPA